MPPPPFLLNFSNRKYTERLRVRKKERKDKYWEDRVEEKTVNVVRTATREYLFIPIFLPRRKFSFHTSSYVHSFWFDKHIQLVTLCISFEMDACLKLSSWKRSWEWDRELEIPSSFLFPLTNLHVALSFISLQYFFHPYKPEPGEKRRIPDWLTVSVYISKLNGYFFQVSLHSRKKGKEWKEATSW